MTTALLSLLRGLVLSHSWIVDGALFLEFGALSPSSLRRRDGSLGNPTGEVSVCLYGGWSCRSEDGDRPPAALVGLKLASGTLLGEPPELDLAFESGVRITSSSAKGEAPEWHLADRRGPAPVWYAVEGG